MRSGRSTKGRNGGPFGGAPDNQQQAHMANYSRKKVESLLRIRWAGVEFLAEGGNSFVFRSERDSIAVKVLRRGDHPRFERFQQEVKVAQSLQGLAGLVRPIDINLPAQWVDKPASCQDLPFFTMQLFEENLTSELSRIRDAGADAAVELMIRLCHIVGALHDRDLAHRDLKPDNILFDRDNNPHVADFGLCIDLESDSRLTRSGELVGSVTYRAPEFLRGRLDESNHRPADVFSLGRILWALLQGREPHGLTDYEFGADISMNPIRALRGGALLGKLIEGCVSADPRRRPTVVQLRDGLEEWKRKTSGGGVSSALARLDEDAGVNTLESAIRDEERLKEQQAEAQTYARDFLRLAELFAELQGEPRLTVQIDGGSACAGPPFEPGVLGVSACGMFIGPIHGKLPIPQLSLTMYTGFDEHYVWYRIVICRREPDGSMPPDGAAEKSIGDGSFEDFTGATVVNVERCLKAGLARLRDELLQHVGRPD